MSCSISGQCSRSYHERRTILLIDWGLSQLHIYATYLRQKPKNDSWYQKSIRQNVTRKRVLTSKLYKNTQLWSKKLAPVLLRIAPSSRGHIIEIHHIESCRKLSFRVLQRHLNFHFSGKYDWYILVWHYDTAAWQYQYCLTNTCIGSDTRYIAK